jgi:hypothetical protein
VLAELALDGRLDVAGIRDAELTGAPDPDRELPWPSLVTRL